MAYISLPTTFNLLFLLQTQAYDLYSQSGKEGVIRLWLDCDMLATILRLRREQPRLAEDALAAAMAPNYGPDLPVAHDTFRKNLGKAVEEYAVRDAALQLGATHGVPELDLVAHVCAACAGSQEYQVAILKHRLIELSKGDCGVAVRQLIVTTLGAPQVQADVSMDEHGVEVGSATAPDASVSGRAPPPPPTAAASLNASVLGLSGSSLPPQHLSVPSELDAATIDAFIDRLRSDLRASDRRLPTLVHSIYFDCCFAFTHQTRAGIATERASSIQRLKALAEEVRAFIERSDSKVVPETSTTCSEFVADAVLARKSGVHDVTGMGGCFCSHHFLLCFLDLFTGERWAYSTFTLKWLLENGILPLFWWYDINCRYRPHAQAWARAAEAAGTVNWASAFWIADVMRYPVPVFHIMAHNARCQAVNTSRNMQGAGRGAGEPTETAWSLLRHWGALTSIMSHAKRDLTLETMAMVYNSSKESSLLHLLVRRFYLAVSHAQQAMDEIKAVIKAARDIHPEWSEAGAVASLAAAAAAVSAPAQIELSGEAQYVEACIQIEHIQCSSQAMLPMNLVLPNATNRKYKRNGPVHKRAKEVIRVLRLANPHMRSEMDSKGPVYHVALLALCVYRLGERQVAAHQAFQELTLARMTKRVMDSRRKDFKRLQDVIEAGTKRLMGMAEVLVDWAHRTAAAADTAQRADAAAAAKYDQNVMEAKSIIDLASTADAQAKALHKALTEGRFPWADVDAGAGASINRLAVAWHKAQSEFYRCEEQCELCVQEVKGAATFWGQRCDDVRCAIAARQEDVAGSPAPVPTAISGDEDTLEAQWEAGVAAREAARVAERAAGSIRWLDGKGRQYEAMQVCAMKVHELLEARWAQIRMVPLTQEQQEANMVEALAAAQAAPGADYVEEVAIDLERGDDGEDTLDEADDEGEEELDAEEG